MASSQEITLSVSATSHRLPTVSATQALQKLKDRGPQCLSTGLPQLDTILQPTTSIGASVRGGTGLTRGQVAEVYGPPGAGKTTFAAQICVNAVHAGQTAVWVDAGASMVRHRLEQMTPSGTDKEANGTTATTSPCQSIRSYSTPTLAHLLALFSHPPAEFPPPGTSIVVIDALSTVLDSAYPRKTGEQGPSMKTEATKWAAGRRFAVMSELIAKLGKMAAVHDLVVLVTCQTITRMRPGTGAVLLPAISGTDWDNGIAIRLVLFRDWPPAQTFGQDIDPERLSNLRFIGVEKLPGVSGSGNGVGSVVPFTIDATGNSELAINAVDSPIQHLTSPIRPHKRRYTEIADSEDEDADSDDLYGWVNEDAIADEGLVSDNPALTTKAVNEEPAG